MQQLSIYSGVAIIFIGILLVVASFISIGKVQTWDKAEALSLDSRRPVRRIGMLIAAIGLAALISALPTAVATVFHTPGFNTAVIGWVLFSFSVILFFMVMGLTNIVLPALGDLAVQDQVSPQKIVDVFTKQPAIIAAFLGGNLMYISWGILGYGLLRSGIFMPWLGWTMIVCGLTGWLSFLHVPIFQQFGFPLWPASVIALGVGLVRLGISTIQ